MTSLIKWQNAVFCKGFYLQSDFFKIAQKVGIDHSTFRKKIYRQDLSKLSHVVGG